jgi:hypothetical protein
MTNPIYNFVLAPALGWLTLISVLVVAYLGRLEFVERRKNRRLQEKRALISRGKPLRPETPRRLAMRALSGISELESNGTPGRRTFQKVDRQAGWNLSPTSLN